MKIDNNYIQSAPNFGKLKSIQYKDVYPEMYSKELLRLLSAVKESEAFNKFFKQYDVDMFIKGQSIAPKYVYMSLKIKVPQADGSNWFPEIDLKGKSKYRYTLYGEEREAEYTSKELIDNLTNKVKKITYSDLKSKLDSLLTKHEEEQLEAIAKKRNQAKLDTFTKGLLSPETEGKNIFVRILAWLLDK